MADALLSPFVAASLVVLVVNDHWLKSQWPSLVTGKVSDVAGLAFFPIVLVALLEGGRRVLRRGRVVASLAELDLVAVITAIGFGAVKTSAGVARWYSEALGWMQWPIRAAVAAAAGTIVSHPTPIVVRADPWDLLALPAILFAIRAGRRAVGEPAQGSTTSPRVWLPCRPMSERVPFGPGSSGGSS